MTREDALELHLTGGEWEECCQCGGSGQQVNVERGVGNEPCFICNGEGVVVTVKYHGALYLLGVRPVVPTEAQKSAAKSAAYFEREMAAGRMP